jgi:hypothetical protein
MLTMFKASNVMSKAELDGVTSQRLDSWLSGHALQNQPPARGSVTHFKPAAVPALYAS